MGATDSDTGSGGGVRLVLCTCPPGDAQRIAEALVADRLAACVNVLADVTSVYRWQGEVTRDGESLLLIKTVAGRIRELADRIREIHPYELPEVIAVPVSDGLSAYISWVAGESAPAGEQ